MPLRLSFIARIMRASITNERELVAYVVSVTAICITLALAVDVTNQLMFFVDWATCLRSWAITAMLVLVLAIPISRAVAKAHLELYRAKMHAEELSRTDQLTGLANRRALMEAAFAAEGAALALVIVDIDRFKRVNDRHGHLAGDEVIRSVGQMMVAQLGGFGCVARVGGEEFALLSMEFSAESLVARLMAFHDRVDFDARHRRRRGDPGDDLGGGCAASGRRQFRSGVFEGRSGALCGQDLRPRSHLLLPGA